MNFYGLLNNIIIWENLHHNNDDYDNDDYDVEVNPDNYDNHNNNNTDDAGYDVY